MKRDCPHCRQSMEGRFLRWSQIGNVDRSRSCPLCGREIEFNLHPEELAARIVTIVVVVAAAYWAKEHGNYLAILVTVAAVLIAIYVGVSLRLRTRQRFRKGFDGDRQGKR